MRGLMIEITRDRIVIDPGAGRRHGMLLTASQATSVAEALEDSVRRASFASAPLAPLLPGAIWKVGVQRDGVNIALRFYPPTIKPAFYVALLPATVAAVARTLRKVVRAAEAVL